MGSFAPIAFGLSPSELQWFSDDAVGAALDELYDANHEALITDVVVAMAREFAVRLDELHADTTSLSFSGPYPEGAGVSIRGQRPPFITRGFGKDHRPDLKQLLLKLTTSSDGDIYAQHGDVENRLKELHDGIAFDRLACTRILATGLGAGGERSAWLEGGRGRGGRSLACPTSLGF